ncbi:MAG: NAD(P)/FAD-dependent oxidoreductase [Clostridia bacterium]|nr:NAD(P)/FAD-dependent oxidoreductase [Clostridia bacterium]MBR2973094.1 NAD(P)/FAD-dependent oxidoreductase [Clostridia bacterium]
MSKNVVIIGGGPAGVSAALYTARAGIDTTIIENGVHALEKAEKIENYYGFENGISGPSLYATGLLQAKNVGAKVVTDEVVGLSFEDKFKVSATSGEYFADSVIIATGTSRNKPKIENFEKFEGSGISYCAVCDGFFFRGKDVAVLGSGEYAMHEASVLLPFAASVTLLTDGEEPSAPVPDGIKVNTSKIKAVSGDAVLEKVVFEDGNALDISGLFIALGTAGGADIAKKIGAVTNGNYVSADENMATNIPGIFAAGDCTGGILQIAKAVYQGMLSGFSAIKFLKG